MEERIGGQVLPIACVGCMQAGNVTEEAVLNIWGHTVGVMICLDCRRRLEQMDGGELYPELWTRVATFALYMGRQSLMNAVAYTQYEGPRPFHEVVGEYHNA